jgi:hypothetical protein
VTPGSSGQGGAQPLDEDVALGGALPEGGARLEDVALGGAATDLVRAPTLLGAVSSWRRIAIGEASGGEAASEFPTTR